MKISFVVSAKCFIELPNSHCYIGEGNSERAAFADALTKCPVDDWQSILKEYQEYLKKEGNNES